VRLAAEAEAQYVLTEDSSVVYFARDPVVGRVHRALANVCHTAPSLGSRVSGRRRRPQSAHSRTRAGPGPAPMTALRAHRPDRPPDFPSRRVWKGRRVGRRRPSRAPRACMAPRLTTSRRGRRGGVRRACSISASTAGGGATASVAPEYQRLVAEVDAMNATAPSIASPVPAPHVRELEERVSESVSQ